MRIDGHAHACGDLNNLQGIINYCSEYQLDKIVLCPGEHNSKKNYPLPMITDMFPSRNIGYGINHVISYVTKLTKAAEFLDEQNKVIADMSKEYPDIILQAYWANPTEDKVMEKLNSMYLQSAFCMVKLHQCWNDFDVKSESMRNIVEWAIDKKCPIFIHLKSEHQCLEFTSIANEYKDAFFIVGHMIGFSQMKTKLSWDNVYFDISAPFMIPMNYLQEAVRLGLANRLILGSDTPYGNHNIAKNIERIERLKISPLDREKILGLNLLNLIAKDI